MNKEIKEFKKNLTYLIERLFEQTESYRKAETKRHINDFCDAQLPRLLEAHNQDILEKIEGWDIRMLNGYARQKREEFIKTLIK